MPYNIDFSSFQAVLGLMTFFRNSAEAVGEVDTGNGHEMFLNFHHHFWCRLVVMLQLNSE